jgi:hypothetical protein
MDEFGWESVGPEPGRGQTGRKTVEELAREFEDVVLDRLRRVEAINKRLRVVVAAFVIVNLLMLAAGLAMVFILNRGGRPAWAAQSVSARQFVLTDAAGRARGTWGVDADGAVRFVLKDSALTERLRLSVLKDGGSPGLSLTDESGNPRVALALNPDETSTLVFADRQGLARAVLGLSGDAASLVFADKVGATKAGLGIDPSGQPSLIMSDSGSAGDEGTAPAPPPSSQDTAHPPNDTSGAGKHNRGTGPGSLFRN